VTLTPTGPRVFSDPPDAADPPRTHLGYGATRLTVRLPPPPEALAVEERRRAHPCGCIDIRWTDNGVPRDEWWRRFVICTDHVWRT
jgi:hypothetical protein